MLKLTRLLILLLTVSSIGCGVPRPNSDVCTVNAEHKNRKCYNLRDDYDEEGHLKPDATPEYRPNATIEELNKATLIDSPYSEQEPNPHHFENGLARLKAYIKKLREAQGGN